MASAQNLPADDQLSFRDKMKFFEKESQAKTKEQPSKPAKQFSYLAEHEIAKLKQEEATKTANMSSEQLRSYVASGVADMRPDHDLDHVLSSLNTRRVQAQQPIPKGPPLSRHHPPPPSASVDNAYADAQDYRTNGSSQGH